MAYCSKCGAYIPDGQTVCVACGFDPEAEQQRAAQAQAQAAAYAAQAAQAAAYEQDLRAEAERRRAERQESDRIWAENERRRRQMEEDFRRAQEEKERRAESYVNRGSGRRTDINIGDGIRIHRDDSGNLNVNIGGDSSGYEAEESGDDPRVSVNIGGRRYSFGADEVAEALNETARQSRNRGLAAISYLGVLVFVPLLFGQEDEFVKFHAKQGLKLLACTAVGSMIASFFGAGWLITLLGAALSIKGLISAVNGKKEELPLLNKIKWF